MAALSSIDIALVAVYFIVLIGIGFITRGSGENAESFVVGSRKMPWLAVLGSLIATEISAATFLSTPGAGFAGNMAYLQYGIGSILARFFIAFFFLSLFFRANCLSIYQYLRERFGGDTHYTASVFFIITRLLASGVRLLIAATGISVILGIPLSTAIIGFTVIAVIYTMLGGIRAVIWTDCVQAVVFLAAGITAFYYLQNAIGWDEFIRIGSEAERFKVFHFTPSNAETGWLSWFTDPNLLYTTILFGFLTTTAAFGTDQDLTQRMLTCKNAAQAKRSLILSGFISIPVALLFLSLGVALYAYYQVNPDTTLPLNAAAQPPTVASDKVFSHFITTVLPSGLKGLLLTGVLAAAMSSLDSAMAALSSSAVIDLLNPLTGKKASPQKLIWLSRLFMVIFATALALFAWLMRHYEGFLWLAFKVTGITYSALLGIFLLGIFTQRGSDRRNVVAMICGASLVIILLTGSTQGWLNIAWNWCMPLGIALTFLIGYSAPKQTER